LSEDQNARPEEAKQGKPDPFGKDFCPAMRAPRPKKQGNQQGEIKTQHTRQLIRVNSLGTKFGKGSNQPVDIGDDGF